MRSEPAILGAAPNEKSRSTNGRGSLFQGHRGTGFAGPLVSPPLRG